MLELAVAIMVLMISMGAISSSLATSVSLSRTNKEMSVGLDAAQSIVEAMRGEEFSEVFARYNDTDADDPAAGDSPGPYFEIRSLRPRPDDVDGFVGEVRFPGDGITLSETVVDRELGMPRDLNASGGAPEATVADYSILPVRVTVEWLGAAGNQRIDLVTTLSRR